MNKRIYSIDVLRGLMALFVMIYHYSSWSSNGLPASNIWARFGIYAVTIFYFVSGFSLMYVYWDKKHFNFKRYMLKRYFRLAPLFYFISFLFIGYELFKVGSLDFYRVFLSFTFLFSIIDPSSYYSTGAWSIGNEMFFYVVLGIILVSKYRKITLFFMVLFSLILFVYFRTFFLQKTNGLSFQWHDYINPLNHLFTFLVGCCSYFFFRNINKIKRCKLLLLLLSGIIFFYPIVGDRINLVVGFESFLFLLSSYAIFIYFLQAYDYKCFQLKFAIYLGDISYSVYLVHPVCWFVIKRVGTQLEIMSNFFLFWLFSILFTLGVSSLTYYLIEKIGMRLGKAMS